MSSHREAIFVDGLWVEPSAPKTTNPVSELGVSSAPLLSAAYFLSAQCKAYNEDFMLCKDKNGDPKACLLEGRKVTRCAIDFIEKLKANCNTEWTSHWECLDRSNHMMQKCRSEERPFNDCVFRTLGLTKVIPESQGEVPVHLLENPKFR